MVTNPGIIDLRTAATFKASDGEFSDANFRPKVFFCTLFFHGDGKKGKTHWLLRLLPPHSPGSFFNKVDAFLRKCPGTRWGRGPSRCTKHVKQNWENWEDTLGKTDDGSDRAMSVSPFFLQLKRDFWSINMTNNGERCRVRTESHLLIQPIFWKMRGTFWIFVLIQKEAPWSFRSP